VPDGGVRDDLYPPRPGPVLVGNGDLSPALVNFGGGVLELLTGRRGEEPFAACVTYRVQEEAFARSVAAGAPPASRPCHCRLPRSAPATRLSSRPTPSRLPAP